MVAATTSFPPPPAPATGRFDATRNIEASAATMHGDTEPMWKLLDTLVTEGTGITHSLA
jgi:hypothetical protein